MAWLVYGERREMWSAGDMLLITTRRRGFLRRGRKVTTTIKGPL